MNINEITRETLRGLHGIVVVVESLKSDAEADGLSGATLQEEIQAKLEQSGVRVLPHEEWRGTVGRPWLYVSINTIKHLFSYFFSIDVQLKQDVILPRAVSIQTSSATWEMGSIGFVTIDELPEKIRESVIAYVDNFISDYRAVNDSSEG
ncbi:MAG TPA: hypothetical protein VK463_16745 [Desulfomonilaceae bacterium]|nr:hypothetical protein [Desulfomonilaceae bacterium]